jgi:hypothetical protein
MSWIGVYRRDRVLARGGWNAWDHDIDRIDPGDRSYEFKVDAQGVTTDIVHAGPTATSPAP